MNRTLTLLTCAALVMGAIAIPVAAQGGNESQDERHASADEKRDQKASDRAERADERRQGHDDRKADAMERRDAMRDEIKERKEAFHAARDACKDAFKERNSTENGTLAPGRCISLAAHDHHAKVLRAAHYEGKMIEAIEKRLDRLQDKEDRVQARIDSGDLNETEMAEAEAKLVRIDGAQEKLEARLAALQARHASHAADVPEGEVEGEESQDAPEDVPEDAASDESGNETAPA